MKILKKKKNRLFNIDEVKHTEVIEWLVEEASPRKTFLMFIFISCLMATLGLLNDNVAVVIGAMLVAPLLWPVMSFAMALLLFDWKLLKLSSLSISLSILVALIVAIPLTFQHVPLGSSYEILKQTNFSFMFPVAIASGFAAAFAMANEDLREALPGIAISVALIPPLVSIGIGLGGSDWSLVLRAGEVFVINLFGIIFTAATVFWLLGFRSYSKAAIQAVEKEEKVLQD